MFIPVQPYTANIGSEFVEKFLDQVPDPTKKKVRIRLYWGPQPCFTAVRIIDFKFPKKKAKWDGLRYRFPTDLDSNKFRIPSSGKNAIQ